MQMIGRSAWQWHLRMALWLTVILEEHVIFYIYEVSENEDTVLLEKRELVPICEAGNHDEGRLRDNVKRLSDCDYVAVSRIGMGALRVMNEYGIAAMELPGEIEDSLHRIVVYDQIQGLMTTR